MATETAKPKIGRFDTPVEDYNKDLRKVETLSDLQNMERKYALILDDATEAFKVMDEANFRLFLSELPKCYTDGQPPSEQWMQKFSAIVLPKLFMQIAELLHTTQLPSGFILNRFLDENLAEIKDGKFCFIAQD